MSNILSTAIEKYENKGYEYSYGGWGGDKDKNGTLDIDCSHLVYEALKAAGYSIPYQTTSALNSSEADKYFETFSLDEAKPGDLILYPSHVGIFSTYDSKEKSGTFFGSQSKGPGMATFTEGTTTRKRWGTDFKILRPREQFKSKQNNTQLGLQPAQQPKRWSKGTSAITANGRRWRLEDDSNHSGSIRPDNLTRWQR